jgi:hypothetical protein
MAREVGVDLAHLEPIAGRVWMWMRIACASTLVPGDLDDIDRVPLVNRRGGADQEEAERRETAVAVARLTVIGSCCLEPPGRGGGCDPWRLRGGRCGSPRRRDPGFLVQIEEQPLTSSPVRIEVPGRLVGEDDRGWRTTARATATRRCLRRELAWPVRKPLGETDAPRRSRARSAASTAGTPLMRQGIMTFRAR